MSTERESEETHPEEPGVNPLGDDDEGEPGRTPSASLQQRLLDDFDLLLLDVLYLSFSDAVAVDDHASGGAAVLLNPAAREERRALLQS